MIPEPQPELLSEFFGRKQASPELLDRAQALISADEALETSPVLNHARVGNLSDEKKFLEADSKFKKMLIFGRMVGRTVASATLDLPKIVRSEIAHTRFERRFKREFPELTKPHPRPDFSRRRIPAKPAEHYARELSDFSQAG